MFTSVDCYQPSGYLLSTSVPSRQNKRRAIVGVLPTVRWWAQTILLYVDSVFSLSLSLALFHSLSLKTTHSQSLDFNQYFSLSNFSVLAQELVCWEIFGVTEPIIPNFLSKLTLKWHCALINKNTVLNEMKILRTNFCLQCCVGLHSPETTTSGERWIERLWEVEKVDQRHKRRTLCV